MTKLQITITLEQSHIDYLKKLASSKFEGNYSMAVRQVITQHSLVNWKDKDVEP